MFLLNLFKFIIVYNSQLLNNNEIINSTIKCFCLIYLTLSLFIILKKKKK